VIAQRLKKESPMARTMMAMLTNGRANSGYIPNDAAFVRRPSRRWAGASRAGFESAHRYDTYCRPTFPVTLAIETAPELSGTATGY
jgi:hypothetical protein